MDGYYINTIKIMNCVRDLNRGMVRDSDRESQVLTFNVLSVVLLSNGGYKSYEMITPTPGTPFCRGYICLLTLMIDNLSSDKSDSRRLRQVPCR